MRVPVHVSKDVLPDEKGKVLKFETKTLELGKIYVNRKDKLGVLRVNGDVFVMPVVFDNRRVCYEEESP